MQTIKPEIAIIVAMAGNHTIGIDNKLPWHIPDDLKRFKALTMGNCMIMGRKTFESIGKPLPGRVSVVVTRDRNLKIPGCIVAHSLKDAISVCTPDHLATIQGKDPKIFVIGGAEIYAQALDVADTLYVTEIQQDVAGNVKFPEFDRSKWPEASRKKCDPETSGLPEYHFVTYHRDMEPKQQVVRSMKM